MGEERYVCEHNKIIKIAWRIGTLIIIADLINFKGTSVNSIDRLCLYTGYHTGIFTMSVCSRATILYIYHMSFHGLPYSISTMSVFLRFTIFYIYHQCLSRGYVCTYI